MWERGGHGTKCFCAAHPRGIGSVPCGTAISLPASPPQHPCDRQTWPGHTAGLEVPPCPAEGNMAMMDMGGVTLKTSVLEAGTENGAETWKVRRRKASWSIQGSGRVGVPGSCLFLGGEGGTGRQGRVRAQTYSRAVEGCDCRWYCCPRRSLAGQEQHRRDPPSMERLAAPQPTKRAEPNSYLW